VCYLIILAASAFNELGQYASSPGNTAYCYAELAVSSLAVAAVPVVKTYFAYPQRDGHWPSSVGLGGMTEG